MRRVGMVVVAVIAAGCGGPEFSDALFSDDLREPDASVGEDAGAVVDLDAGSVDSPSSADAGLAQDAGGNACAPRSMPAECQCAGTYTCECLLASAQAPTCPGDASASCIISYPELGGIVVFGCGL